jgi:hypothetical protein
LTNLKLLYPSSGFTGAFFYTYLSNNYINITNCYIVSNSTNNHTYLYQSYYGYLYAINTNFHTHSFHSYPLIYYVSASMYDRHYFTNCTFKSMRSIGSYPAVLYCASANPHINFTGCTFTNMSTNSTSTSYGGVIYMTLSTTNHSLSNNSFIDVACTRPCLRFASSSNNTLTGLIFNNVSTSLMGGGAVYIPSTTYVYRFVDCWFTNCVTTGTYNGGFFSFF